MTAFRIADFSEWRPLGMVDPNRLNAAAKNAVIAMALTTDGML